MIRVLVLCTGNSARSILAEAVLNRAGNGAIIAASAGSQPTGRVNPYALALLESRQFDVSKARSKSWDDFSASAGAAPIDVVITVCDSAAGEACPLWPGAPTALHIGFEDPAAVTGDSALCQAAFERVFAQIEPRMTRIAEALMAGVRGRDLECLAQDLVPGEDER